MFLEHNNWRGPSAEYGTFLCSTVNQYSVRQKLHEIIARVRTAAPSFGEQHQHNPVSEQDLFGTCFHCSGELPKAEFME